MPDGKPAEWVDFEKVKEQVPFDMVLGELKLMNQLRRVGDEIRGRCPLCGVARGFSANPVKRVFHCFGCRKGGDVIDFVAVYQKIEKKQAAVWLASLIPSEKVSEQTEEIHSAIAELGLTDREVRLLQLMNRAHARHLACVFSMIANADVLEQEAWQDVCHEIHEHFPETRLSPDGANDSNDKH